MDGMNFPLGSQVFRFISNFVQKLGCEDGVDALHKWLEPQWPEHRGFPMLLQQFH